MNKRPKVRYLYYRAYDPDVQAAWYIRRKDNRGETVCKCYSAHYAKRIAAALNFHEAVKRGEIVT